MKTREGATENCQIQLHHNPETAQDLFKHLQPQTIHLPPLENGEILIKVLYIALDPSLKPLLVGEKRSSSSNENSPVGQMNMTLANKNLVYDHPPTIDEKGTKSYHPPNIDITSSQSNGNSQFANYFPPPFSKQQEWIENNHPSLSEASRTDSRRILNYGVLKAYAVGEVIESKNHLFTKGRNVYGNLGVQQYLLSNGGKDLDDNMIRDITMDSPLSAFLTLSKAGLCAYFGVTELANVSEGDCVFVTGGTGCVGSFVPQIVRASLADTSLREGIKKFEEEHPSQHTHDRIHKSSPSSSNSNRSHNLEKTSICSASHCLVPHRTCNKAKSPTLSWLFNSLIEEEDEQEYDLSLNEDEEFPTSSHEVISRGDETSEATHFVHDPIVTPHGHAYHSPEQMEHPVTASHGHHHHLPHHVHQTHNVERLHLMNSAPTHKNPAQIKIFGFCSSDSRKSLMLNKLKYDNAINYSHHMKKKMHIDTQSVSSDVMDDPSLSSPVCVSCLTPAWSSVSPFSHIYGASSRSSDNSLCMQDDRQQADTCLLKTGQKFDYSNIDRESLSRAIGEMCPDGIDVVFDTVGGVLLDLCLEHLKMNARIVICGAISNNNSSIQQQGHNGSTFEAPHNYVNLILKCARMEGFMVEKFQTKFKQASHTLVRWIQEKKIDSLEENVIECDLTNREEVISTIGRLFSGEYYGKLIIRVK